MNIAIRNEVPTDYALVENIAREAFWNLYTLGAVEHVVVHKLRKHHDFIRELSFVIEVNGQVVGAIFYSHSKIVLKNFNEIKTITFGPVFIAPEFQRKSLGYELISYSIEQAKEHGYVGILALGYPYHYAPYGFVGAKKYNISHVDGKFYKGLLALPLFPGALACLEGQVVFSDVFNVSSEEVEEFDKYFPPKEKEFQLSQKEYELACAELDE